MLLSKRILSSINPIFNSIDDEKLVKYLNGVGIEVENIIKTTPVLGLECAKILSVEKIENTDKLHLCSVASKSGTFNVVCGAPNVEINKYVVFAPIGTKFSKDFIIEKRKIKNIESCGMLCGYNEINPSASQYLSPSEKAGIIILDNIAENEDYLNVNIYEKLNLEDSIFELALPSNRNDLNGVLSIVNELNYKLDYGFIFARFKNFKPVFSNTIKINNVKEIKDCLFFNFQLNKPYLSTPWFIKSALINSHINTYDTLVDIGNYITLLLGQPVHLYDFDKLGNSLNIIKTAEELKMTTINNNEIIIPKESIVGLAKDNQVACMIGVIGSAKHKIDQTSKNILVEIINLDSSYMANLNKKLKFKTTASNIFSKPLSSFFIPLTYNYFRNLLLHKYCESFSIIACYINKPIRKVFPFDGDKINALLGTNISKNNLESILNKTNIVVTFANNVKVPLNRLDIENSNDLAEEILKSIDINEFESKPVEIIKQNNSNKITEYEKLNIIHNVLLDLGFFNTKTYNLTNKVNIDLFNVFGLSSFKLSNPISSDKEWFRVSLIHSLLEVFVNNLAKKEPLLNLYEIQTLYSQDHSFNCLSILLSKPIFNNLFGYKDNVDLSIFIQLILDKIFNNFNVSYTLKDSNYEIFDKLQKAIYINDKFAGYLGCLNPNILKAMKYNHPIIVFEINLDLLVKNKSQLKYNPVNQYNNIERELTLICDEKTNIVDYIADLKQQENILDVKLINVYLDSNQQKSYTIKIIIDNKNNLVNEEINKIFNDAISLLKKYDIKIKQ